MLGFGDAELLSLLTEPGENDPAEAWQGMPEFEHRDIAAHRSIIVHFRTQEAVDRFATLLEQPLTDKTKVIWFPKEEEQTHVPYVKVFGRRPAPREDLATGSAGRLDALANRSPELDRRPSSITGMQTTNPIISVPAFDPAGFAVVLEPQDAIMLIVRRLHGKDCSGLIDELGLPYVKLTLRMRFELWGAGLHLHRPSISGAWRGAGPRAVNPVRKCAKGI
jgi:hypothetical protein